MSATTNLGLPYIDAGQAQKHITHNEALRALDTLVQLAVQDRDLLVPPASPAEGQRWIVKASASGVWTGHDNQIAAWQDGAWQFSAPIVGWVAYVIDEGILVAWDGASWIAVVADEAPPTTLQNLALLGIGTSADTGNPLSAKLNNVLWTAKTVGEGGDGTLRYKLNKESSDKTLSLLLQTAFSGRAELGLAGDDDFHFKVSPDGSAWFEALKIDRNTGKVFFPINGGPREILSANRTYYVRSDGSDSNDGFVNTSSRAFLTLQKAINAVAALDLSFYNATIQVADGTYTAGVVVSGPWVGAGNVSLVGNTATPANCVISVSAANGCAIQVANGGYLNVSGFKLSASGSAGDGLLAYNGGHINVIGAMVYGATARAHIHADTTGVITIASPYSISAAAAYHYYAFGNSYISANAAGTITLSGTPAFSSAFAAAQLCSAIRGSSNTYSGAATGKRYDTQLVSVISTNGAGASYFPGSVAGATATGSVYS